MGHGAIDDDDDDDDDDDCIQYNIIMNNFDVTNGRVSISTEGNLIYLIVFVFHTFQVCHHSYLVCHYSSRLMQNP
jgi:mRNA-degrading endonuclease HigB of HigAB toxin-antitoxin module